MPDYMIQITSTSELPIEVMQVVVALVHNLLAEKNESHSKSLRLVCGILKTPSGKELRLPWSPIHYSKGNDRGSTDSQSTQKLAMMWMLNRLSLAVTAFDEKARHLWALEWAELCWYFMSQSTPFIPNCLSINLICRFSEPCFNLQSTGCRYSHKDRTNEDCSSMLTVSNR